MKNLSNKALGKDKGIAIIFSLVMLTIFFLIAFGFLSVATSASDASKIRAPRNNARIIVSEYVLSQAIRGLESPQGLVSATAPDPDKLFPLQFINWH